MAHINFLGNIKKRIDNLKVMTGEGQEDYEPHMILYNVARPGRSFAIPLSAMWKYIDPKANMDVRKWDYDEFSKLGEKIYFERMFSLKPSHENTENAAAVVFAEQFSEATGILYCTSFSLYKACCILDLTVGMQTLSQLLNFIQDGLDDLKNGEVAEEENYIEEGEIEIIVNGEKHHFPLLTTQSDLAMEQLS